MNHSSLRSPFALAGSLLVAGWGGEPGVVPHDVEKVGEVPQDGQKVGESFEAVAGGTPAGAKEFPWVASVQCPAIMCNGVIVGPQTVVTTASCVNSLHASDVTVYAGSNRYYTGGKSIQVATIIPFPNYDPATYANNIALLKLASPVPPSMYSAIRLAKTSPAAGVVFTTAGFGATDPQLTIPDTLQKANLTVFSLSTCQTVSNNKLKPGMFCAGDITGARDLCSADQGAPAMGLVDGQYQLYGIYNWGCSCGTASKKPPSHPVFTDVAYFQNWIQPYL